MDKRSYGKRLAKELNDKFNLSPVAMERLVNDIDTAILAAFKIDVALRPPAPPSEALIRKREKNTISVNRYKAKRLRQKEKMIIKSIETIESEKAKEKILLNHSQEFSILKKSLSIVMKDDFPGRTYSNEIKLKINRLKELESLLSK